MSSFRPGLMSGSPNFIRCWSGLMHCFWKNFASLTVSTIRLHVLECNSKTWAEQGWACYFDPKNGNKDVSAFDRHLCTTNAHRRSNRKIESENSQFNMHPRGLVVKVSPCYYLTLEGTDWTTSAGRPRLAGEGRVFFSRLSEELCDNSKTSTTCYRRVTCY